MQCLTSKATGTWVEGRPRTLQATLLPKIPTLAHVLQGSPLMLTHWGTPKGFGQFLHLVKSWSLFEAVGASSP